MTGVGSLTVERGSSLRSRCLAGLLRLPRAGPAQPLRVRIDQHGSGERWRRRIGGRRLDSRQRRDGDVLVESVGPVELRMRMRVAPDRIMLTPIGAALRVGRLRIPLPAPLAPRTTATATATAAGFELDARISIPWLGLLIAYRGTVREEGADDG